MKPSLEVTTGQPMLLSGAIAPTRLSAAALRLMSDDRLARLAAKGERAAFATIFDRYHQALYRYSISILGNHEDASDALQNTMLRALKALEGERREIALRPWLYRITHNESISLLRRRPAEVDPTALSQAVTGDVEADAAVRARLRELLDDIRGLPDRQRGSLVMRELGGLDYSEIAVAFGVSHAAAKQSVYEARCALHELAGGRDMNCEEIRRKVSDGDRRALRARTVRSHLRACVGCSDFEAGIVAREWQLGAVTPVLPAATASTLLHSVFASSGGGGVSGGGLLALIGTSAGVKALMSLAIAASVGAGTAAVVIGTHSDSRRAPTAGGNAAAHSGRGPAGLRAQSSGAARRTNGVRVTGAPGTAVKYQGAGGIHGPIALGGAGRNGRTSPTSQPPVGGGPMGGAHGVSPNPSPPPAAVGRPVGQIHHSVSGVVGGVHSSLPVQTPSLRAPVQAPSLPVHVPVPVPVHVPPPSVLPLPSPGQVAHGALPPLVSGLGAHP